jgi:hypothetical protein
MRPALIAMFFVSGFFLAPLARAEGGDKPYALRCDVQETHLIKITGVPEQLKHYTYTQRYRINPSAKTVTTEFEWNTQTLEAESVQNFTSDIRSIDEYQLVFCEETSSQCKFTKNDTDRAVAVLEHRLTIVNFKTMTVTGGVTISAQSKVAQNRMSNQRQWKGTCVREEL